MPEIDLDKLSPETRAALERELKPKPQRSDQVAVNFTYDPDDAESVKKGYERGHLTADDLAGWGWALDKLGIKVGTDDDDDKTGDDKTGDEKPPRRRGYFESAA